MRKAFCILVSIVSSATRLFELEGSSGINISSNNTTKKITFSADAQEDKRSYRVDFTKIHRALPNYQPQWTAYKGVGELLDSFKEYGLELNEFEGPRYRRVSHIKKLIKQDSIDSKLYWTQKEMQKS